MRRLFPVVTAVLVGLIALWTLEESHRHRQREDRLQLEIETLRHRLEQTTARLEEHPRRETMEAPTATARPMAREPEDLVRKRRRFQDMARSRAEAARAIAQLPRFQLNDTPRAAFVIDTSGSMRDPTTGALKLEVILQIWKVLADNPQVEFINVVDADGRSILEESKSWIPNTENARNQLEYALLNYEVHSGSDPVPGIIHALHSSEPATGADPDMSVIVFGDEYSGEDSDGAVAQLNRENPADADGSHRVSINAIAFAVELSPGQPIPTTVTSFAELMKRLATEHDGRFVAGP